MCSRPVPRNCREPWLGPGPTVPKGRALHPEVQVLRCRSPGVIPNLVRTLTCLVSLAHMRVCMRVDHIRRGSDAKLAQGTHTCARAPHTKRVNNARCLCMHVAYASPRSHPTLSWSAHVCVRVPHTRWGSSLLFGADPGCHRTSTAALQS
jgi:hypothetical protein